MTHSSTSKHCMPARRFAAALLATASLLAFAGPGAHGPGGEHLDQPAASSTGAGTSPRFEAATDLFELVAHLAGGELSMLIDRFDTNAPVLGANVSVESAGVRADAKFHADHGDYAVDDPVLLAALSKPGQHALVITVVAGNESDLLNGTLVVAAPVTTSNHDHDDHDHAWERAVWTGAGAAALGLIGGIAWWRRRRRGLGAAAMGAR